MGCRTGCQLREARQPALRCACLRCVAGAPSGRAAEALPSRRAADPPPTAAAGAAAGESDLPTDYQYSWAQESYSKGQRTRDTWSFVLTLRARLWLLDQAWSYGPGGKSEAARSARARALAAWIRERILQLGPTFIKLGQVGLLCLLGLLCT